MQCNIENICIITITDLKEKSKFIIKRKCIILMRKCLISPIKYIHL